MMGRPNSDSTPPSPLSSQSVHVVNNVQIFIDQQQQQQEINGALSMSPYSCRPSFSSSSSSYHLSSPSVTVAKPLHNQTSVWSDSEMTPYFTSFSLNDSSNPKSSVELVKEIISIETEILLLERYLLSLYHRTGYQHGRETKETPSVYKIESNILPIADRSGDKVKRISGSNDHIGASIAKSPSKRERSGNRSRLSLGDHLIGTSCTDGALLGGPDRLSEDIVRCISSIYCKLGDPNHCHQGPSDSSASSSSTSTRNLSDTRSPCFNKEKGPNAEMIQVLKIGLDDDTFDYASKMLKHFRTLIKKLEHVNPGKMKREQKLAFWINIHNALVMHAHLAYGTHNSSRTNSILKATYNVGGHCINAHMIQSSILGIRSHFRASWLHSLLSPGRKLPSNPSQHVYAIEYSEPLVHFALSLGSFSDPAVRIYKAKNVFQDLRVAKEEFIRSTVYIHKESKIYIPKILYYFAKDIALTMPGLFEMINACLPKSQQKALEGKVKVKPDKYVCWVSQSSIFRYVIHRDAIEGRQSV